VSGGSTKIQLSDDVIHQPVQDEIVLLNLKTQQYYGLDDVGSRMLNLLLEHKDVNVVAGILLTEYQVEPDKLHADLQSLVQELAKAGILVISDT
jgi:hypothetical protein